MERRTFIRNISAATLGVAAIPSLALGGSVKHGLSTVLLDPIKEHVRHGLLDTNFQPINEWLQIQRDLFYKNGYEKSDDDNLMINLKVTVDEETTVHHLMINKDETLFDLEPIAFDNSGAKVLANGKVQLECSSHSSEEEHIISISKPSVVIPISGVHVVNGARTHQNEVISSDDCQQLHLKTEEQGNVLLVTLL